jgi:O-antigen ligase
LDIKVQTKQHHIVTNHDMPEYLRSLIYVLIFATTIFVFARPTFIILADINDFTRRRNLWFFLTLAAFLATNFWIYTIISIMLLIYANKRESNPPALFFSILFILPVATIQIPGMGVFNFLFELSNLRILELFILLPAYIHLIHQNGFRPFSNKGPDLVLTAYLVLNAILHLRDASLTEALRQTFYLFIDVYLPYFVISRSLQNLQTFRDALMSLVMAIMILAPLAIFESLKHWHLYSALTNVLQLSGGGATGYLERNSVLRSVVTAGQPIALGYLMTVGIGLYLFVQQSIKQKLTRSLGMALLIAGLISSFSRGPWVGAAVLLVAFIATGRYAVRRLITLAVVLMIASPVIPELPGGRAFIDMLPIIGSMENENITYRQELLRNSMIVINRNPWFGSDDYLKTPEMQSMMQGEGIIDIVNSYIGVALDTGLIGLGLFVAFFAVTFTGIFRTLRSSSDRSSEEYLLGRTLLVTLLAILIIIFTVSSITIIPIVNWSVAGLAVAYIQMMRKGAVAT